VNPRHVPEQLTQAIALIMMRGGSCSRTQANCDFDTAGLEVGTWALLRRGLIYDNNGEIRITKKGKERFDAYTG